MSVIGDTIVIAYLVGATVNGCAVFVGCLMRNRSQARTAAALGIVAGMAWPMVLIGLIQMLLIAAVLSAARYIARARVRRADRSAVPLHPTISLHPTIGMAAKNTPERRWATRVEVAGWGITLGPILIASVHRPSRVLVSASSHAPASVTHCSSCCPQS